jgi:hypothetical protein
MPSFSLNEGIGAINGRTGSINSVIGLIRDEKERSR